MFGKELMACLVSWIMEMHELFTKLQISDWSKIKALADDKIDVIQKIKFVLGQVENILGKGENASYQHLKSPFPIVF